jgi:hypothetical protein
MDPIGTDYTSYRDLSGKISIDFPGDPGTTDFKAYAESIGIDVNRYRPMGLELFAIESSEMLDEIEVRLLAYDTQDENRIVRFNEADNFKNLLSRLWRLSITVTTDGEIGDKTLTREIEEE